MTDTKLTKERVGEWVVERLGLVYLGLTQLAECPGYWEQYYEDEIEPLEAILSILCPHAERLEQEKAEAELELARPEIERLESGLQFGPCQAEGCKKQADAGEAGPDGYKWLCHEHALAYRAGKDAKKGE